MSFLHRCDTRDPILLVLQRPRAQALWRGATVRASANPYTAYRLLDVVLARDQASAALLLRPRPGGCSSHHAADRAFIEAAVSPLRQIPGRTRI